MSMKRDAAFIFIVILKKLKLLSFLNLEDIINSSIFKKLTADVHKRKVFDGKDTSHR